MHYGRLILAAALVASFLFLTFRSPRASFFHTTHTSINTTPIRRKLWQTSRLAPMALEDETKYNIALWNSMNPNWRHEVLTDDGSDEYIRDRFAQSRPDIVEVYTALKDNILRADFFRYLVLLGDGGVYSDMDTEALKPIDSWIPQAYKNATNVVVGIEYDTMGGGRGQALLDLQLVNWTIMSAAGHGLMELVVKNVIDSLTALAQKQGVPLAHVKANFNDVLACTGPVQLTRSTWQYLSQVTGEEFTWRRVSGITEPVLVHDVLILVC